MKLKSAVKRLCEHCYMVRRGKTLHVRCKKNPRHKQRQGFATLVVAPPRAWAPPFAPRPAVAFGRAPDHEKMLARILDRSK
jgi:large subunit ribosomal protein L36